MHVKIPRRLRRRNTTHRYRMYSLPLNILIELLFRKR